MAGEGAAAVDRAVIEAVTRRGGPQDGGYGSRVTLGSLISRGEAPVSRQRLGAAHPRHMKTGALSCPAYVPKTSAERMSAPVNLFLAYMFLPRIHRH